MYHVYFIALFQTYDLLFEWIIITQTHVYEYTEIYIHIIYVYILLCLYNVPCMYSYRDEYLHIEYPNALLMSRQGNPLVSHIS